MFGSTQGVKAFFCMGVVVTGLFLSAGAQPASGDGGYVSRFHKDVWEPEQLALLLYDEANQVEDLVILPSFEGESVDFAWIVPLPTVPEIQIQERRLFEECSGLTQPIYRDRGIDCPLFGENEMRSGVQNPGDVEIYSEEVVGIYETKTVGADSASVLLAYLDTWGYLHDQNRDKLERALQHYIDKSWCFVVMMDTTTAEPYYDGFYRGGIDPVHFRFTSDEPVYPMRISAISAPEHTSLLLYVCMKHRTRFEGSTTEYANRFNLDELEQLARLYPHLGRLIREPCFLTKLRRTFTPDEMNGDLVLERAPTDQEFRGIRYTGFPVGEALLLAMVGWGLLRMRTRTRSRTGTLRRRGAVSRAYR